MTKPIVAVIGATGSQGGSVARALLQTGEYSVRAITRNTNSEQAKLLASLGAEVVKGDASSLDEMKQCFAGAYAVYAVTNTYDPNNQKVGEELRQGKNMANAALNNGVQHFIWSTLVNSEQVSEGKFKVDEFDDKHQVEEYVKEIGLPATFVDVAFYYENIAGDTSFQVLKKEGDTVYISYFIEPDVKIPMLAVSVDLGKAVVEIISNRNKYLGKTIPLIGKGYTFNEYAEIATKVTGIKHEYRYIPPQSIPPESPVNPVLFEFFNWMFSQQRQPYESNKELGIEWVLLEDYLRSIGYGKRNNLHI
ncbi:uncharacterized protein VTP21DRAFT_7492 [Calcarisporiella thermophila]|uniref:uncharacterized protein n=1 Tax=Calcarisporiella thermophila TaxID=911321 RepID=UPI003743CECD